MVILVLLDKTVVSVEDIDELTADAVKHDLTLDRST